MEDSEVHKIVRRVNILFNLPERLLNEAHWAELTEYLLNNQSGVFYHQTGTHYPAGTKKMKRVFTSMPFMVVETFVSALQDLIINPSKVWCNLKDEDEKLM